MSHDGWFPTMWHFDKWRLRRACAASFKLRNSKWCSASSLTIIEYSSDKLWSDCAYAQADLRLCWSHIPHCWKSHVTAQILDSIYHIQKKLWGAWWPSGRVLSRGHGFEPHWHHCVVSLSKTHWSLLRTGSTQEDLSWHKWKIVDWDLKNQIKQTNEERGGSVVECLTRDRWVAGLILTGCTALCSGARHFILLLSTGSTQADLT